MKQIDIKEWINDYKETFDEYFNLLNNSEKKVDVSNEEIAFSILENAGLYYRYTNDKSLIDKIDVLSDKKKSALLLSFIDYLNDSTLPEQAKNLAKIDALSEDELEQAKNIISFRDEYEAAIETAKMVFKNILSKSNDLTSKFAKAIVFINNVDFAFLDRKDISSVASRILIPFINEIKAPINKNNYWWLDYIRKYDEMETEISSNPAWSLADVGISPTVFKYEPPIEPSKEPSKNIFQTIIEYIDLIIDTLDPQPVFAYASATHSYKIVSFEIYGKENLIIEFSPVENSEICDISVYTKDGKESLELDGYHICNKDKKILTTIKNSTAQIEYKYLKNGFCICDTKKDSVKIKKILPK